MLREDGKPVKRYRVCGDLARYVDEEDLMPASEAPKVLAADEVTRVAAVIDELAQVLCLEQQSVEQHLEQCLNLEKQAA